MIVQMKKVSIVVLNKDRKVSLDRLKEAGVVHIEHIEGAGEKLAHYKEFYNNIVTTSGILGEIKLAKTVAQQSIEAAKGDNGNAVEAKCKHILELVDKKKKLAEEITGDTAELDRLAAWGDIDPADFDYLSKKGIALKLFEIPEDKYSLIDQKLTTIMVSRAKKVIRFILVNGGEERPEGLPPEAYQVSLPAVATLSIKKRIENDRIAISSIDSDIQKEAVYRAAIDKYRATLEDDILFENVYSGMQKEDTGSPTDLSWLSGYVPVDSVSKLQEVAKQNAWAISLDDVEADDEGVPTKLKNNGLVSLVYPLTDFLGTVPGYHEYDISGWFLLFFTIFFGMIFGDGGYGLLITIAALIMKAKSKKPNALSSLMLLLGIATIAWGTVTCTWFGLLPKQLPEWLIGLSVPQISNAYSDITWLPFWSDDPSKGTLTSAQNLQIFCFTLAFLQLTVAHLKGIKRYHTSLKVLGEFGAMLQLWGMYYVVLSMVVSSSIFSFGEIIYGVPIGTVSIGLVAFGFALSFIFSNYDGSVGKSILESCKNIISVLLGVVNVFSDIVSYIRLWAVGLAGAAISNTVNQMAGPLLGPALMFIAFLALVVFGHGLNMVLNLLSVIVHGVRLNTLEFSTHLGMSWSGFKYSPFAAKNDSSK